MRVLDLRETFVPVIVDPSVARQNAWCLPITPVTQPPLLIHELGVCAGLARVDIALVNGSLHGFEIKSEALKSVPGGR